MKCTLWNQAPQYAVIKSYADNPSNFNVLEYFYTKSDAQKYARKQKKCPRDSYRIGVAKWDWNWGLFPNPPRVGEYSPIEKSFTFFTEKLDLSPKIAILIL